MNNNWEEEFDKEDFKWFDTYQNEFVSINDHPLSDKIKNFISTLLKEREAEIRKEYDKVIDKLMEDRAFDIADARKETIEAVLPREDNKIFGLPVIVCEEPNCSEDYKNGFLSAVKYIRQSIIDSAKEKFNINLE